MRKDCMHIGLMGPVDNDDIRDLVGCELDCLPRTNQGAGLVASIAKEYVAAGHRVTLFTCTSHLRVGDRPVLHRQGQFSIYYIPARGRAFGFEQGRWGRMLDFFKIEREGLLFSIEDADPDILHAHWAYEYGMAALNSGKPYLITCHDDPLAVLRSDFGLYRLGRFFMASSVIKRAEHLSAVSMYLVHALGVYASVPISLVPNPIPEYVFDDYRRDKIGPNNAPAMVMILSDWGKLKNPKPAMRAAKIVRSNFPGAKMHLIGNGFGLGGPAHQFARENGIEDHFVYHGRLTNREAIAILASADVMVHPSLEESFGMTIAESMIVGVPIVAGRDSGAVPLMLKGGAYGTLVDVRDPDQISAAITSVLCDHHKSQMAVDSARAWARSEFHPKSVAMKYESILMSICEMTSRMAS